MVIPRDVFELGCPLLGWQLLTMGREAIGVRPLAMAHTPWGILAREVPGFVWITWN